MNELTVQKLKGLEPDAIFATGMGGFPRLHGTKDTRWVAVRGRGTHDWAIYYHLAEMSDDYVRRSGDKVFTEHIIKELVPCDEEAFAMYRY